MIGKLLCPISIISILGSEGLIKLELIKGILSKSPSSNTNVWGLGSTMTLHPGDPGSIPCMNQQILKISFSPSHSSGVTKPSFLKLGISGITNPSDTQRGE